MAKITPRAEIRSVNQLTEKVNQRMEIIYQRLTRLVLAQGIVRSSALQRAADLCQDLVYRPSGIAELVSLAEQDLMLRIPTDLQHSMHPANTLRKSSRSQAESTFHPRCFSVYFPVQIKSS